MADIEKFQEKVKLHCKERKVSQERLASKVGLSSSELSRRLNGKEVLTPLYVKLIGSSALLMKNICSPS